MAPVTSSAVGGQGSCYGLAELRSQSSWRTCGPHLLHREECLDQRRFESVRSTAATSAAAGSRTIAACVRTRRRAVQRTTNSSSFMEGAMVPVLDGERSPATTLRPPTQRPGRSARATGTHGPNSGAASDGLDGSPGGTLGSSRSGACGPTRNTGAPDSKAEDVDAESSSGCGPSRLRRVSIRSRRWPRGRHAGSPCPSSVAGRSVRIRCNLLGARWAIAWRGSPGMSRMPGVPTRLAFISLTQDTLT